MTKPVAQNTTTSITKMTVSQRLMLLTNILDSATLHSIIAKDLDGNILTWNMGARYIYGYDGREVVGKQHYRILHVPEDVESGIFDKFLDAARQTGVAEGIFQCVRKNRERFAAAVTTTVCRNLDGTPSGLLSISKDVSSEARVKEELQRKNKELEEHSRRNQEANRLKGEFLVSMSHRLRTPLNSIIGFAKMIFDGKAGPTSARQREFLDDIISSGRHLLQLINNVLDLARVESGSTYFVPEPIDLVAIADETCDMFRLLATNRAIQIRIEADQSLSSIVGDLTTLKQLLYNFLSNALRLTIDGCHIVVRTKPEGIERFILEVEATGIGLSPDDIRRLLHSLEEPDTCDVRQHSIDISLALLRRVIEAQGGEIGIRSTPGRGSIFWARLLRKSDSRSTPPDATINPQDTGICILVVDDDPSSLKLAQNVLTHEGYRVICASDGEEGLRLIQSEHPAAIVLDLIRNGIDGFEFLRRLRKRAGTRIPVIVWSGKTFTQQQREHLLCSVDKIVDKGDGGTKEILDQLRAAHLTPLR